jgi:DNA-binding PadR family transcriptional regulator
MHDLTAFQRDILFVIAGLDELTGLAVKAELEEYYEKEIYTRRLYPNLDHLVEKELATTSRTDDRTIQYALSERGRRGLAARHDWERQDVDGDE